MQVSVQLSVVASHVCVTCYCVVLLLYFGEALLFVFVGLCLCVYSQSVFVYMYLSSFVFGLVFLSALHLHESGIHRKNLFHLVLPLPRPTCNTYLFLPI